MNLIFTCGGTAGHINPAIAVANTWKARYPDSNILFIGATGHMEEKLVQDVTGAFAHTVVVLNVGGMVDTSWIRSNPRIDGALLAWQAGMEGGLAAANKFRDTFFDGKEWTL